MIVYRTFSGVMAQPSYTIHSEQKMYNKTVFTIFSAFSSPISWTASTSILWKQKPHESEEKKTLVI